jgi:hypothetical protein
MLQNRASFVARACWTRNRLPEGLYDHRLMAIECKVSNSSMNPVKHFNKGAAAKAEAWLHLQSAVIHFGKPKSLSSKVVKKELKVCDYHPGLS